MSGQAKAKESNNQISLFALQIAKVKKKDVTSKCWWGHRGMSLSYIADRRINCYWLLQNNMEMCIKLKMNTPFEPVIPHLIIYLIKMTAPVHKDVCTRIFTIALYDMVKHWKLECPSTGEW